MGLSCFSHGAVSCTVPGSGIYVVCHTMTGTVHVINGSTAIAGSSTAFSATAYIHGTMCILGGGGVCQQVHTCTSTTACTFETTYTGTTNTTASFQMAQVCYPAFNSNNTCTFPSNITAGDTLWSLAIIDLTTGTSFTYKDGAGNALTNAAWPAVTGSVTSGTIGVGDTVTQGTTGVTATVLTPAPTGSQILYLGSFSGRPDATHTWTDGTTSGVYTPSGNNYAGPSPCLAATGGANDNAWMAYTLSAASSSTATIVFANTPTDNVDEIAGVELAAAGGTISVDTNSLRCAWSTTSTNAAGTIPLANSTGEWAFFGAYVAGTLTGFASPWTILALDISSGEGFAFDGPISASSVVMGLAPTAQGPGTNAGMAFKFTATASSNRAVPMMVR